VSFIRVNAGDMHDYVVGDIYSGRYAFTMTGGTGNYYLDVTGSVDNRAFIHGDDGDDQLYGRQFGDTIYGGNGLRSRIERRDVREDHQTRRCWRRTSRPGCPRLDGKLYRRSGPRMSSTLGCSRTISATDGASSTTSCRDGRLSTTSSAGGLSTSGSAGGGGTAGCREASGNSSMDESYPLVVDSAIRG